jgi:hypothetical protein
MWNPAEIRSILGHSAIAREQSAFQLDFWGYPPNLGNYPPKPQTNPPEPEKMGSRPQKIPPSQGCFFRGTPPPFLGSLGSVWALFRHFWALLGSVWALFGTFWAVSGIFRGVPPKKAPEQGKVRCFYQKMGTFLDSGLFLHQELTILGCF